MVAKCTWDSGKSINNETERVEMMEYNTYPFVQDFFQSREMMTSEQPVLGQTHVLVRTVSSRKNMSDTWEIDELVGGVSSIVWG